MFFMTLVDVLTKRVKISERSDYKEFENLTQKIESLIGTRYEEATASKRIDPDQIILISKETGAYVLYEVRFDCHNIDLSLRVATNPRNRDDITSLETEVKYLNQELKEYIN